MTASKKVGVTGSYEYKTEVNGEQKIHSPKANIYKKYKDLTDDDIEKLIKAGNTGFTKATVKVPAKDK